MTHKVAIGWEKILDTLSTNLIIHFQTLCGSHIFDLIVVRQSMAVVKWILMTG